MSIFQQISQLVDKGIEVHLMEKSDAIYVRNQLLGLLELDHFIDEGTEATDKTIPDLVEEIISYAIKKNVIEDVLDDKEILSAKIMDCFLSKPSAINETFYLKYETSPEAATNYFYELSKHSNYIQTKRISNNVHYETESPYGTLDITINLSKPEKDPEQIKRERNLKKDINYPTCLLCVENEGYVGRTGHPARSNHRVIEVPLVDETWYFQYSPYVYYNEHSIVLAKEHRDMKINQDTFTRLLAFVDQFPHYFIGSNADLPIVGGSILSHDHYQAGRYEFAMTKASEDFHFDLKAFPDVDAAVVKWPMSVIRLKSDSKASLIEAATTILNSWKTYSDSAANIQAFTGDTPHNTITPIARVRNGKYELDLVLRNNRTTDEHPLGIFHPHEDVHHIKKENIGLIEVMGLAVLPARLKQELEDIRKFLLEEKAEVADYHQSWAEQIKADHHNINPENVESILQNELGKKFTRVLEDSGVFKANELGRKAFHAFLETLNE
ncbi:UDP-glucose--hexose-1-phosphate uridylyltransferase [Aquibacillus albus]|uniref:Galactose-1-phosphate uridylyltransferase n=1 Tax=Aquibacillus albus TaxID=1168171 RepID=A0ABS2MY70_9BACI|nr:UDP-glucose--hexose-1-phosphate uridylyltransferase [Aquibacillus albus]MBM7570630.1 UDPglucose--hexose-1-phosphate uridylyltransferase [Aquibacillus albus]